MKPNIGSGVLILYIVLTYLPQSIASLMMPEVYAITYNGYSESLGLKILFMAIIIIVLLLIQSMTRAITPKINFSIILKVFKKIKLIWIVWLTSALYICLAVPFAIEFGFSFYHTGNYLSELPAWVVVVQALKSISRMILAYYLIKTLRRETINTNDKILMIVNIIASAISIMGAIDIIFIGLSLIILINKTRVIATYSEKNGRGSSSIKKYFHITLLALLLPWVVVIGFANKIGFERTFEMFSDEITVYENVIIPLSMRVSSSHGSFIANSDLPLSINEQLDVMSYPVGNLIWRSCIIFIKSDCPERGDITHLARANFTRTFFDQSPAKAGATPGLLASVLYFPVLPLSLLVIGLYCALVCGAIQHAIGRIKLNIFGYLVVLLFIYPLWENPIDNIIIFDPAVIYNIGIILILLSFPFNKNINILKLRSEAKI